jgi:hypothetical protein
VCSRLLLSAALSPFILNSRLKGLMLKGGMHPQLGVQTTDKYIINVSAMEGKFYRHKSPCLAFGTKVFVLEDGKVLTRPIEDVVQAYAEGRPVQLLGQDQLAVNVVSAHAESREDMVSLSYSVGRHLATPNHLVTLRFSRNPRVNVRYSPEKNIGTVGVSWWCAKTLTFLQRRWRFLPMDDSVTVKAVHTTLEVAQAWARYEGTALVNSGAWESAQVTDLYEPYPGIRYVHLILTKGHDETYTRKTLVYKIVSTRVKSRILPTNFTEAIAREYAWQWLVSAEKLGFASPLRVGDLIDVPASTLRDWWLAGSHKLFFRIVAIPLVDPVMAESMQDPAAATAQDVEAMADIEKDDVDLSGGKSEDDVEMEKEIPPPSKSRSSSAAASSSSAAAASSSSGAAGTYAHDNNALRVALQWFPFRGISHPFNQSVPHTAVYESRECAGD